VTRPYVTALQIDESPELRAFMRNYPHLFEHVIDRDIYYFKGLAENALEELDDNRPTGLITSNAVAISSNTDD
jgi:hypothetical protein